MDVTLTQLARDLHKWSPVVTAVNREFLNEQTNVQSIVGACVHFVASSHGFSSETQCQYRGSRHCEEVFCLLAALRGKAAGGNRLLSGPASRILENQEG